MILIQNIPFIQKRKRVQFGRPPAALVLVAATFVDKHWLNLTFDRAIDIAGIEPAQFIVDDEIGSGERFAGFGTPTLTDPATVKVEMSRIGDPLGTGTLLFATASTG